MIIITPINFDPAGPLKIKNGQTTDRGEWGRRANRVATLDGGVAVNDFGFSEGDRTVVVQWDCTREEELRARQILAAHRLVNLSMDDGLFEAVPLRFNQPGSQGRFTLLITRRLA